MKKEYFPNYEYNRIKRRNSIFFSVLLGFLMIGMASIFALRQSYVFAVVFLLLLLLPVLTVPSAFKNFPIKKEPVVVLEDKKVTISNVTLNIKDVIKVTAIIELAKIGTEEDVKRQLEKARVEKPENVYFGNFDVAYKDDKGKTVVLYSTIEGVVDALETAVKFGLKNYVLKFSLKKNVVVNEWDFSKATETNEDKPLSSLTKKQKSRQLI